MFKVTYKKFDSNGRFRRSGEFSKNYRTKREAIAHFKRNGFVQDGGNLSGLMHHPGMHCNVFICKA